MRKDLAKCTTECYRHGAGSLEHTYKIKFGGKVRVHPDPEHNYDDEFGGFRSSARRRHKESKNFGDKLGALRGNLRANLGRPWDQVFSEFCQVLDRRGLSGYHIWTHLTQEVEINCRVENGKIYARPSGYYRHDIEVSGFYVHPVTGILCYKEPESSYWWFYRRDKGPTDITMPGNETWFYRQIDGLWFRCTIAGKDLSGNDILIRCSANKREIAWIRTQI